MSVHPLDDGALAAQFDAAAEDPQAALDSGLFAILSKDRANRAVWRLGRELADLDSDEVLYSTEIQRLDQWIKDRRRRVANIRWFVEGLCEAFHAPILEADPARKTIKLPAGELQARKKPDTWNISDSELIAWADANNRDYLVRRPDPEVIRNAVKKLFEVHADGLVAGEQATVIDPVTGEVPPGVTVTVGETGFSVRPYQAVDR